MARPLAKILNRMSTKKKRDTHGKIITLSARQQGALDSFGVPASLISMPGYWTATLVNEKFTKGLKYKKQFMAKNNGHSPMSGTQIGLYRKFNYPIPANGTYESAQAKLSQVMKGTIEFWQIRELHWRYKVALENLTNMSKDEAESRIRLAEIGQDPMADLDLLDDNADCVDVNGNVLNPFLDDYEQPDTTDAPAHDNPSTAGDIPPTPVPAVTNKPRGQTRSTTR
jgi:hypothetical protein